MKMYARLSKIKFLENNYTFKFLFIAFLGIHIPLIGLLLCAIYFQNATSIFTILFIVLIFTLIATIVTFYVLKGLIQPIEFASKALINYRKSRVIPKLPMQFTDEAGMLMLNIQETIEANERLLDEKQDLMYIMTHDMKNYIYNPAGLAQLIIDEKPSEVITQYANLILESIKSQTNFIETFTRLLKEDEQISKEILKIVTIDCNEIIAIAHNQLKAKLESKNIKLKINSDVSSVKLKINPDLLIRVIVNLIDNAIKFSYTGSQIQVNITKEQSKFEIAIIDQGIGFNIFNSNDLFAKFTKMSRLGTENEKSTGIGLYLCQQIIKKANGNLTATSSGKDKGSTFTIILKVYK